MILIFPWTNISFMVYNDCAHSSEDDADDDDDDNGEKDTNRWCHCTAAAEKTCERQSVTVPPQLKKHASGRVSRYRRNCEQNMHAAGCHGTAATDKHMRAAGCHGTAATE